MERSDTIPIFPELEDVMQETSFHERFNTNDIGEILSSHPEDQKLVSVPFYRNTSTPFFENIESDPRNQTEEMNIKIENDEDGSKSHFAAKKILKIGDEIFVLERDQNVMIVNEPKTECQVSNKAKLPSLSLHSWEGNFNFNIEVSNSLVTNSKWAYSPLLKKLFLKPFEAVPIAIKVSTWINGYINITPVFTESQYISEAVVRCPNHRQQDEAKDVAFPEHIVQVDNADAKYRTDTKRHSVDIPLGLPAPGESSTLVYVKCGCWNTCVGGPDRKPFCLVFTLFNRFGEEIGRQVLDLKVCSCPIRDRGYAETAFKDKSDTSKSSKKNKSKIRKNNSLVKEAKKIKSNASDENLELILVPREISTEVKRYINMLIAEKYAKDNNVKLPF